MKKLIIAIMALVVALGATAQNAEYSIKKGDKVTISRSVTHYLTGQKIAPWVYDEEFTVLAVGGKTYPNGVLLDGIMSWVSLESVGATKVEPQPAPEPAPAPEPVVEPAPVVVPAPAPVVEPEPAPAPEPAPVVEPAPAPEPVVEPTPEPQPALRPAENRFGIGVRGGVSSLWQQVAGGVKLGTRNLGAGAVLDLEYTFLGKTVKSGVCQLGFKTGVSLAYGGNSITAPVAANQYERTDCEGRPVTYTVEAQNLYEYDHMLMVQVPLMFTIRGTEGFYMAVGPRFGLPVYSWYTITYREPNIDCYYPQYNVHETNQVVTGRLNGVAPVKDNQLRVPKYYLMVAGEIGYEFALKNGNGLGLLLYGDYDVYSQYKYEQVPTNGFINVSGPKAGGPEINSYSLMNSVGNRMSYFNAGLKLVYTFCWPVKK